ncbi:DUF456 domain-containing protein [Georgenia yuyongxinii]|uniref:DUF456 domain-containing protein n=1 Tax=Georgenia yuyongxinii TaxID=2589797 RepID=A0A5B8C5I6_9MICO|nr:DUF456 domain-containing protein [Georgenia yuyongxinii]QDC25803.1 DUF456 domain-containing protein [Georgenia yuyongxinii]
MAPFGELLVGAVILVGLVGAVVQLYPGGLLVLGAVGVWGVVTGGVVGWTVLVIAAVAVLGTGVAKYLLAGRYLTRAGVPGGTLLVGGVLGVVGFFVVPVVGLPLGFVLGVFLAEMGRRRNQGEAWRATVVAMKATGLTILIELAGALVATGAWVVGLLLT